MNIRHHQTPQDTISPDTISPDTITIDGHQTPQDTISPDTITIDGHRHHHHRSPQGAIRIDGRIDGHRHHQTPPQGTTDTATATIRIDGRAAALIHYIIYCLRYRLQNKSQNFEK